MPSTKARPQVTTTLFEPEKVPLDLITLTNQLGAPQADLAILAEGNTSVIVDEGRIAVKASGASMATATATDFVTCSWGELTDLMRDTRTSQADLTDFLDAGVIEGQRKRGSIETLIHAAIRSFSPIPYVAHTHPTALVALLSSVHQETAFDAFVYSDEAVVLGSVLYVPYAQPGIDLGRLFLERMETYIEKEGTPPSLAVLANHGIVSASETWEGALAISLMANKGARIRLDALAAGGVIPLSDESVRKYFARDEIVERRRNISGA
jgi:rhamnose utilization protein RhaD (predicted bifunctional aldolase and dehydrogenase)